MWSGVAGQQRSKNGHSRGSKQCPPIGTSGSGPASISRWRAGCFGDLAALVEEVVQHLVGLQLWGVRLVHLPPELLVALEAGGEAGFGEAGQGRGHAPRLTLQ